jgi:hypothetical protein
VQLRFRGGRADGPPPVRSQTRSRVPATLWLGLTAVVTAMAYSLLWNRVLGNTFMVEGDPSPRYPFRTPADAWCMFDVTAYVANGALGSLYEACGGFLALPLFPILLAPASALAQALGLTGPPVATPTSWLLLGTAGALVVFPLLAAVGSILPAARRGLRVQLAAMLLVFVPAAVFYGHFEDVLAAALLAAAVRLGRDGRWLYGALAVGAAVACKQWALLAVPLLIPGVPRSQWRTVLLGSAFIPFLLGVFTLAADWSHASRALLDPPTWPAYGHPALWVDAHAESLATAVPRAILLTGTLVLAWRLRARPGLVPLLAGLGVALLARCFLEPVLHPYYACPGLLFLLLHERCTTGTVRRTLALGLTFALWGGWHGPAPVWWGVAALLCGLAAAPAVRTLLAGPGPVRDEPEVQVEPQAGDSSRDFVPTST